MPQQRDRLRRCIGEVLDGLRRDGFTKLSGAVSPAIVARLQSAATRLERRPRESWDGAAAWYAAADWRPTHFAGGGQNAVVYDCLGLDAELDAVIEEFVGTPSIRELVRAAVGEDHRLWYVQLRWAEAGGAEYELHQDVYGELALCVYLSDHPDAAGSIVWWPGSHLWPRVATAFAPLYPAAVAQHLGHVTGVAGDMCVFLNKTWHGRTSAGPGGRLVFLISFIPPGPIEKRRRIPDAVRSRLGPELQRVTAPSAGRSFGTERPVVLPFSSTFEELAPDVLAAGIARLRALTGAWSPQAVAMLERALESLGLRP